MSKYFENFPLLRYSLDEGKSQFIIADIFRRVIARSESLTGTAGYDFYQLRDGDTPEIVAHKVYGDPNLHWVILIANEVIDPRFEWLLPQAALETYVKDKYGAANQYSAHHYENSFGDTVYYKPFTGLVDIGATGAGSSISVVGTGTKFTTEILTTGFAVRFGTTTTAYTVVAVNSDTSITVSGAAVTADVNQKIMLDNYSYSSTVTTITNQEYEEAINESRRAIRLIKPQYVPSFVKNFVGLLTNGN